MNGSSSWIEPPPHQRGLGCFAKGCLILVVFGILLGLSFVAGTYYASRFLRTEYFSAAHERLPISHASVEDEQAVRTRWNAFEKAARAHEPARIELSADDLNALIASDPKLRGDAFVSIEDNTARFLMGDVELREVICRNPVPFNFSVLPWTVTWSGNFTPLISAAETFFGPAARIAEQISRMHFCAIF